MQNLGDQLATMTSEPPQALREVLDYIEDYIRSSPLTAKDGDTELLPLSEVPTVVHLVSERHPNLLRDVARLSDDQPADQPTDVQDLIQGPINADTLFGARQILDMILCAGSRYEGF